nr:hypothetical protein [Tanacetum cinerariifolium]
MKDMMLELLEDSRQKELYCMRNEVEDLIESTLNSKLLSINLNSQRLDKEKQEVKNIVADEKSLSNEDVPMIYSNSLFDDEEIIPTKIDPYYFNAESNLLESLLNRDTLIDSSPKFDYLLEEFSSELAHIDPVPPGIEEADFDLEEEIRLQWSLPLSENVSSNFDHHDDLSFPRPPPEPPDVEFFFDFKPDAGVLTAKMVEDIFEHYVLMLKVLPTQPALCPDIDTFLSFSSKNEDKVFKHGILSYLLVSHQDKITFDFFENPMMICGRNIPHLDVPFLHFYPL